ncbi:MULTISPECIES: formylglycine-generating enzyme family protein [unclassified Leptolyngbya]|uniref:formylglycine-generating enzyme family protein n=1 Tax=unclassified Leptolyngbya TaxID=2650499 RepID=UPI001687D439|nr:MULTISPECIES: formylglycine-generating enzyme family protein [unclassified Leptolyngbya]MBD1913880.1 formylglycine-generating enzyme family protein [Leptolyngbya sp. FACHB-8]MBD2157390.1 formylglycine-generating enzyme family protein [Leptolyngbya sp. FACHB-16]
MPELIIHRLKRQTHYYAEDLGNGVALDMVLIPAGTFSMGSPESELERGRSEGPLHPVTVPQFFMGRYPITQAQWLAIAGRETIHWDLDPDPSGFSGDDRPVEQINWHEAVEFCDRLSQATGRSYRLPSEAEWEYACRAGTTTPFHFGDTIATSLANYNGRYVYGDGQPGDYREETNVVTLFNIANSFGLCEMHGNVWEWCLDHWHDSYEGAPADGSPWLKPNDSAPRVQRGGSWIDYPRLCRSAYRRFADAGNYDLDIGFRVVCAIG